MKPKAEPINKEKTSKAKKPKFSPTVLDVPFSLIDEHGEAIIEFWSQKEGKRTEAAWNFLIKQLEKIKEDGGDEALSGQIEQAIANGWQSITFSNYEKFGKRQLETGAPRFDEPPSKHPAHKVFTRDSLGPEWGMPPAPQEDEEANWPPSQTGGKGVLEPGAF